MCPSRTKMTYKPLLLTVVALLLCGRCKEVLASSPALYPYHQMTHRGAAIVSRHSWGISTANKWSNPVHILLRGGSTEEEEYDDEGSEDEYDSEDAESDADAKESADETNEVQIEMKVEKFDEPLVPSPMMGLYASLGVMILAKRIDLFNPTVVRIARFMFIAYLIALQAFVLYVRIKAKSNNDRTPLTLSSPLSGILNAQLGEQSDLVKGLASSFLSSEMSVMEYDLKQARSMQSGLLFNMAFMWFLHFKMNQVQPLIIQTITGLSTLIYSPLFQVYVMGRNLERPFKNPAMKFDPQKLGGTETSESSEQPAEQDLDPTKEEAPDEANADEDSGDDDEAVNLPTVEEAPKELNSKSAEVATGNEGSDDGSSEDGSDTDE